MTRHHIIGRCCRVAKITADSDTTARLTAHLNRMGRTGVLLWAVYAALAVLPSPVARWAATTSTLRPIVGVLAAAAWAGGVGT